MTLVVVSTSRSRFSFNSKGSVVKVSSKSNRDRIDSGHPVGPFLQKTLLSGTQKCSLNTVSFCLEVSVNTTGKRS